MLCTAVVQVCCAHASLAFAAHLVWLAVSAFRSSMVPHKENISQHACCEGQCGKVEHFSSRTKLFKHLREKHGVGGFHRRGRNSRIRRQESRAALHSVAHAVQPQPVPGPHRQWNRMPTAVALSPANGVNLPAKASAVRSVGTSPAKGAISPAQGATTPSSAPVPSLEKATTVAASALPSGSRLVSPEIGASLPAEASSALATAPASPAEAPQAAGDLLSQITGRFGNWENFARIASDRPDFFPGFLEQVLAQVERSRAPPLRRFIDEPGAKRRRDN